MKPFSLPGVLHGALVALGLVVVPAGALAQAHPRVSPDGSRVAHFRHDLDAQTADILVTDLETGDTSYLPTGQRWSVNPVWSPEGDRIVFIGGPRGMRDAWDVYEVRLDDGAVTAVTRTDAREMHTQLSPAGDQLAFVRMDEGTHVWVLDQGATEARQLTTGSGRDFHPKWAPDGLSLVFDRADEAGATRIMRVLADNGTQSVVAEAPADGRLRLPSFTPSGEVYAILSVGARDSLVGLDAADSVETVLQSRQGEAFGAFDFHPDGRSVFLTVTGVDGHGRLYRIDLQTGARTLIHE